MAADPVQAIVDFSASVQALRIVAPLKQFLPSPGEIFIVRPVHTWQTLDFRRAVIPSVHPGPYVGTQVIREVDVSETSVLGLFRAQAFRGPDPFPRAGRPGTLSPTDLAWRREYSEERFDPRQVLISEEDLHPLTAIEYYSDNSFYLKSSEFGTELRSISPTISGEVIEQVCSAVNNPFLNPILRGDGDSGGSVRPEEGLLYPRKV
jgi:hypothetical protein